MLNGTFIPANYVLFQQGNDTLLERGGQAQISELGLYGVGKLGQRSLG